LKKKIECEIISININKHTTTIMSGINAKRILRDIKMFRESNLEENGIYCHFNPDNISEAYALIIGPKDNPYQYGFYLFHISFTNKYPFEPPKVLFITRGKNIRFNPNLYVEGKVCLSILGTWAGPGWTSCCTLNSVLLSIQSLLHEYPIQNEPGWEKCVDERSKKYNEVVEYGNVTVATIGQIEKLPRSCESFRSIMIQKLGENQSYFKDYLKKNMKNGPKKIITNIYGMQIADTDFECYYGKLLSILETNKILTIEEEPVIMNKQRKTPSEPAKDFEEGTLKIGGDGRQYIVNRTPTGQYRWNLVK
jgi:ubiquitin-protein ligase